MLTRLEPLQGRRSPALARQAALAIVVLLLQACAVTPAPTRGSAPAAEAAPQPVPSLVIERHWLQSWFKGTPVRIVQHDDGAVGIDVPREFCFDSGRNSVKPALAAVLDKLAESLRRTPPARLDRVAAPGDSAAPSALALQRATQVRRHLLSRGVPAAQLGEPSATSAAAVQLRMALAPQRP